MVIEKERIFVENSNRTHEFDNLNLNTFEPFPKNTAISKVFRRIGLADELVPVCGMLISLQSCIQGNTAVYCGGYF